MTGELQRLAECDGVAMLLPFHLACHVKRPSLPRLPKE
jgi:hypothetical protein